MEVSPNLDSGTREPDPTIVEIQSEEMKIDPRSRNCSESKMNEQSDIVQEKIDNKKKVVTDKLNKKKTKWFNNENESDLSYIEQLENDSEMENSSLENPIRDNEITMKDQCQWFLRTVGGTNLTSNPAVVSSSGKYIFISSEDKIHVYGSKSGQLLRQLNTGRILAIQKTNVDEEIVVASRKKVVVWNFKEVKITFKWKISHNKVPNYEQGLECIYIPVQFYLDHEIFVTVSKKEKKLCLYRINLQTNSNHKIFQNINSGSVNVGNNDNTVAAVSDHREHGFKDATLLVYDKNLAKNISMHTDKERPYTCVRVHPFSKVVAAGDISGRILVYSGELFAFAHYSIYTQFTSRSRTGGTQYIYSPLAQLISDQPLLVSGRIHLVLRRSRGCFVQVEAGGRKQTKFCS